MRLYLRTLALAAAMTIASCGTFGPAESGPDGGDGPDASTHTAGDPGGGGPDACVLDQSQLGACTL